VPRSASSRSHQPRASSKKEATHERILAVASRTLRRAGFEGVGVADVMKEAGLTHGGFYAHFDSREALLAEALERTGRDMAEVIEGRIELHRERDDSAFRALIETYLADANLPALEAACPVSALSSELARCVQSAPDQPGALQVAARDLATRLVGGVRKALPKGVDPEAAPVITSTLMGALQLARTLGNGPEAHAVLAAARTSLLRQYARASHKA
jgi:TetR/AcrR family transcriptional repressor of nem operon